MSELKVCALASIFSAGNQVDAFDRVIFDGLNISDGDSEHADALKTVEVGALISDLLEHLESDLKTHSSSFSAQVPSKVMLSEATLILVDESGSLKLKLEQLPRGTFLVSNLSFAIEKAQALLSQGESLVSIGALNTQAKLIENRPGDHKDDSKTQHCLFSYDHNFDLAENDNALASQQNSAFGFSLRRSDSEGFYYAKIEASAYSETSDQQSIKRTCKRALSSAGIGSNKVESLDLSAFSIEEKNIEFDSLSKVYAQDTKDKLLCIGSVASSVGYCRSVYELAAFVKTVLSVYHRFLPGVSSWSGPINIEEWEETHFYVNQASKSWFVKNEETLRVAGLSLLNSNGGYAHILISDAGVGLDRPNKYFAYSCPHCVPFSGDSAQELKQQLNIFCQALDLETTELGIRALAKNAYQSILDDEDAVRFRKYRLVLIGEDKSTLLSELALFDQGIDRALSDDTKTHWEFKTPKGSYFTAKALGESGKVSFVFPGLGSSYVGLGQDIFHLFPSIFKESFRFTHNVGEELQEKVLYPRRQQALTFKEKRQLDMDIVLNLKDIGKTDTTYSCICAHIITDVFHVSPDMAFGYSMGEANMMTALDVWLKPTELERRFKESDIFKNRLYGELKTVREMWSLDSSVESEHLWTTLSLKASKQMVQSQIKELGLTRVYLTLVNTDDNVVIAGDHSECMQMVKSLGCRAIPMGFVPAIHCEPTKKEYEGIAELYSLETSDANNIKLYSSSCYLPVPLRQKAIAYAISKCFCEPVDYPRLVNRVYEDGARIFIEAGAGRTCSTWIDKILKGKEHVIIPLNAKGTDDHLTFTRVLAKLFCHKVNVNLLPLYDNV